jgi:hypothetical protein
VLHTALIKGWCGRGGIFWWVFLERFETGLQPLYSSKSMSLYWFNYHRLLELIIYLQPAEAEANYCR